MVVRHGLLKPRVRFLVVRGMEVLGGTQAKEVITGTIGTAFASFIFDKFAITLYLMPTLVVY